MTAFIPHNIPRDLSAWRPNGESMVERGPPKPKQEAWLRQWNGPYREARERQERARVGAFERAELGEG